MLGIDSAKRERNKQVQTLREYRQKVAGWIKRQTEHSCYVEDQQNSVANVERQLGNPVSGWVLKRELEALNTRLRVEPHPWNQTLMAVYELRTYDQPVMNFDTGFFETQSKEYVCSAQKDLAPEFSVMQLRYERVPVGLSHIDRSTVVFRDVPIPGREQLRGWRTVLAHLVNHRLLSVTQADRLAAKYSSSSRESWAALTGKSKSAVSPF